MVAVKSRRTPTPANPNPSHATWYGQLVLCFTTRYTGKILELCLVRWLDRAKAVSERRVVCSNREQRASVRTEEAALNQSLRGAPFDAYRWELAVGSTMANHPSAGSPHYGVVNASHILYVVPMIRRFKSRATDTDPVFFLNTDMWDL